MALDFNNRNPDDPNGIYRLDTASASDAWVNDDWTQIYYSQAEATKNGAKNKVRVATAVTNDGKKYDVVLGSDGKPISQFGDTTGQDDDVARAWKDRRSPAERKPVRTYNGTDPATGRPAKVSEWPDGSKTYEELPASASASAQPPEQKDEGGSRYIWQPNPGGPNAGGKWVRVGDAPETPAERQAREANAPTQTVRVEEVNGQKYTVITLVPKPGQPGQPGQIVLGPDGQVVPGGVPGKARVEKKEFVQGPDKKTYIRVTVQKPDGTVDVYHTDQNGVRTTIPDDPSTQPEPAGAPRSSFTLGDATKDLESYTAWLHEQVRQGKLTVQRADELREARRQLWETAIREQQSIVNAQQAQQNAAITQRGQTLQDLGSRRTSAVSLSNQASSDWMPLATKLGANANGAGLLGAINYARQSAQGFVDLTGANREVPEVQPGPALAAVNGMGLPGSVTMPQTPAFLAGRANQLGFGAIGQNQAPQPIASTMPPAPLVGGTPAAPPYDGAAAAQAAAERAAAAANEPGAQAAPGTGPYPPAPVVPPAPPAAAAPPPAAPAAPVAPLPAAPPPAQPPAAAPAAPAAPSYNDPTDGGTLTRPLPPQSAPTSGPRPGEPPGVYVTVQRHPPGYPPGDKVRMSWAEWQALAATMDAPTLAEWTVEIELGPSSPSAPSAPSMPAAPGGAPTGHMPSAPQPMALAAPPRARRSPDAGLPSDSQAMTIMPPSLQAPPSFLARIRPNNGYNPQRSIQAMIADPNWDNQAVAQAVKEMYGLDINAA